VHERRRAPGHKCELLAVEAELEDVSRLRGPSELRVGRLVRAVGLSLEKVRDPTPPVVHEDARVDDVDALRESLCGLPGSAIPVVALDLDDLDASRPQLLQVGALVLLAFAPDQVGLGVVRVRRRDAGELERRQVLAGEERGESRRRAHRLIMSAVDLRWAAGRRSPTPSSPAA
jgi:hypothetical protein